jgi:hypothetical protein
MQSQPHPSKIGHLQMADQIGVEKMIGMPINHSSGISTEMCHLRAAGKLIARFETLESS